MAETLKWIEFHITTTDAFAPDLETALMDLGALAITLKDAGENPIYEPALTISPTWKESYLIALFESSFDLQNTISFIEEEKKLNKISSCEIRYLADENWIRKSLDQFKPIQYGKKLWICPSWHKAPEPNAINVILDPGLAFGTGSHPTTTLCLEWLEKNLKGNETIIDYGCGSGILGLAALKLGAKDVYFVDYDPQALIATQANLELNHLPAKNIFLPNNLPQVKVDIVIANILTKPLLELASFFKSIVNKEGHIVLSGILATQQQDILNVYCSYFTFKDVTELDGWLRMVFVPT